MTRKTLIAAAVAVAAAAAPAAADVVQRPIAFQSAGETLRGTLHLPAGHAGGPLPTVVVTGAWTTVEEQMPFTYARALAERGFAAVTFDFRGWGGSDGAVRYREDPAAKIADIRAAFAATLPEADAASLHGLGICASAGYMADAAAGEPLVRSIAMVAPWLQNEEIALAAYGGAEGIRGLVAASRAAAASPEPVVIPAAGPPGSGALMAFDGYYVDPARGAVPEYDNRFDVSSWEGWLAYAPADRGARLDKPLLVVHSEAAAIPQGVRTFVAAMTAPATELWLEGVGQFDFYDGPEHVARAADAAAAHFRGE